RIDSLKELQEAYLLSFGQNIETEEYFAKRFLIGQTHERIGLDHKWYFGSYSKLFEIVTRRLVAHYPENSESIELVLTLQKVMALDVLCAEEAYYHATTDRLSHTLEELERVHKDLEQSSQLDHLTQISNRRHLMERLDEELNRSQRYNRPFSLLIVDVDSFKKINDDFGHLFGDYVLTQVAKEMRAMLRNSDVCGRFGGDEFIVGLIETDAERAFQVAERLLERVSGHNLRWQDKEFLVTVTIGVATFGCSQTVKDLIAVADKALYRAKTDGRNRVYQ
ncbi:MAG: diguanylate cyclase, partial [Planctomycetota bacterium]|nr:diguanylate cyclase [Planctomycetota bacterium]